MTNKQHGLGLLLTFTALMLVLSCDAQAGWLDELKTVVTKEVAVSEEATTKVKCDANTDKQKCDTTTVVKVGGADARIKVGTDKDAKGTANVEIGGFNIKLTK